MDPDKARSSRAETSLLEFQEQSNQLLSKLQEVASMNGLNELKKSLDDARQQLAEGVEWWAPYDVRASNDKILILEQTFDASKRRLQPRRKFRFGQRKSDITNPRGELRGSTSAREKNVNVSEETDSNEVFAAAVERLTIAFGSSDVKEGTLVGKELSGKDLTISDLENVVIKLASVGALRVTGLRNCQLEVQQIEGSFYVTSCLGCKFVSKSRQLRIHDTKDCEFRIDVRGDPIIEKCSGVRFAKLGETGGNRWDQVKDFSWLREEKSANWSTFDS